MSRFVSGMCAAAVLSLALGGCSSSSSTTSTSTPTPAIITLSPSPSASVEIGQTLQLTATAENMSKTTEAETFEYQSSNTAILTISSAGLICAGTWDSLSAPTVCTPGAAGSVKVWATAHGVSSAPTTVYIHQHIDSIVVSQITNSTTPQLPCVSSNQTADFQANAFSRGVDITSTVGIFSWQAVTADVVTLNAATLANIIPGLQAGQVRATAKIPGTTPLFASVDGVTSLPLNFVTCAVQAIALTVNGSNQISRLTLEKGTDATIGVTVLDSLGNVITGVPLTWCSSDPASVTIGGSSGTNGCTSNSGSTITASTANPGGSAITASCTPPNCNIGFLPSQPVYGGVIPNFTPLSCAPRCANALQIPAENGVNINVSMSSSSTTTATSTSAIWVSSTSCGTSDNCTSTVVPVSTPNYTVGNPLALPATPNSFVFSRDGSKAFLGTDSGEFGARGLMVLAPSTTSPSVAEFVSAPGKVLAVSPSGSEVVVSDTTDTPNQVYLVNCGATSGSSSTSACSSVIQLALNITGATAAAISPDALKVFIVAGSTLYVYSTLDALQTIPLGAPATDVTFSADGAAGYLAGGEPSGVSYLPVCDSATAPALGSVSAPGITMLRALPDGTLLGLAPPDVQTISVNISGTLAQNDVGCPAPRGPLVITNTPDPAVNLGVGKFTPEQFILSSDGLKAYIVASGLSQILVFDTTNLTTSGIPLTGNALPLQASLTEDGTQLYVIADDGKMHVLDTTLDFDSQQISFPQSFCQPSSIICAGNLIAVQP